jgi:hypothetical protein
MVTDLPTPDVPMMHITSPARTSSDMPRRTGLSPNAFHTPRNSMFTARAPPSGGRPPR